ncbi:MAG: heavy metal translocating P-type ATPase [Acidobacteriota bacterium]|nr:heavy metal translocating P-type ATPase [Acidobacteriota bacterium]
MPDLTNLKPEPEIIKGTAPCKHCGEPAYGAAFCCGGCETAWDIIHAGGWEAYYKVRDRKNAAPVDAQAPSFAYLGTPAYLDKHTVERDGLLHATWFLNGLRCPACTWLVESVSKSQGAVTDVQVNFSDSRMDLAFGKDADLTALAETLAELGYIVGLRRIDGNRNSGELLRLGVSGALAANLMLMSLPFYAGITAGGAAQIFSWVACGLATVLLLYGARPFFTHARIALKNRAISLDLPIALGLSGAYILSTANLLRGEYDLIYFDSMGMLVFFLLLGRYIQGMGVRKALSAGRRLLADMPQLVTVLKDGVSQEVSAEDIQPGDHLQLATGDLVPVDGILTSESAVFNLHVVSGESHPVEKAEGDRVLAGAVNMGGATRMIAESAFDDSRFAQLENMARDLRRRRPKRHGSLLATAFLAVISLLALAGMIAWWPAGPVQAASVALTLFIVACPCALALAEPTARAMAWAHAARRGVWMKDEEVLDKLTRVREIIYDKTGLLTNGTPQIVESHIMIGRKHWLEAAVMALENATDHPIVHAFRAHLSPHLTVAEPKNVRVIPGAGVSGSVEGRSLVLAAPNRLERFGLDRKTIDEVQATCDQFNSGDTLVCAVLDNQPAAVYVLRDDPREEAGELVSGLRKQGLHQTIISGDRRGAVLAAAAHLGVEAYEAEMLPEQKLAWLKETDSERVLMAGDGLNDMGALAAAGVAVTHDEASRAAVHFADVVLQGRDIGRIQHLFTLAKVTRTATYAGYALSLTYNAAAVSLALAGLIGPLTAAILMPLSSLTLIGLIAVIFRGRSPWVS